MLTGGIIFVRYRVRL